MLCWPLCSCLHWCQCSHLTGLFAVVAMGLLPLLSRCLHCCCTGIVVLVAFALLVVVLALLPLLHWHCDIIVLASSPTSLRWHCCHCFDGAIAVVQVSLPLLHCHCCCHCAGIVAVVALALSPSMRLLFLPLLHWRCLSHCACVFAIIALAWVNSKEPSLSRISP